MSDVVLTPSDKQFMQRLITALAASDKPDDRWAAQQWADVLTWYNIQHADADNLLAQRCPHCDGAGVIVLTPNDVWPYGQTLLRALRGGAPRASSELPPHPRGNPSTRTMALKALVARDLVARDDPTYAASGGLEPTWRLTRIGAALVRELPPAGAE